MNTGKLKRVVGFLFGAALVGGLAVANTSTVNQGSPGSFGAWPVRIVAGSGSTASNVNVTPQQCGTVSHKSTTAGVAAAATPSSALASRRFVTLCNSAQNTGSPLVKCRADGTDPVMAVTNPGDVLGVGDCITYPVASTVTTKCIADTATTYVTSLECT